MTAPIAEVRDCLPCDARGVMWSRDPYSGGDWQPVRCPACDGAGAHVVVLAPGGER